MAKAEEVLAVLGGTTFRVKRAFSERWIDVHVNQGKRSGAYSGGSYDTNAFMLLNWQDTLDNLFTLVHETGHSMHCSYTRETQPMSMGTIPSSLPKSPLQPMKIYRPNVC